jgi:hypothetical protein
MSIRVCCNQSLGRGVEAAHHHCGRHRAGQGERRVRCGCDPELLIDAIFGPIYYRMLLRLGPLTEQYGNGLISQAVRGTQPGSTNIRDLEHKAYFAYFLCVFSQQLGLIAACKELS